MSLRLPVADLPGELSIFRNVSARPEFAAACARTQPRSAARDVIACKLPKRLLEGLRGAALHAIEEYGLHGWLTSEGRSKDDPYLSLSLTYNPDLDDPGVRTVHQSTLGTSVNRRDEFYYGQVGRFAKLKHSYFDTYGFRIPTPAARIGALGEFLGQCRLSMVRSRLSVLRARHADVCAFDFGWHRDEPVFENLRLNIPLFSHRSFRLEIEHQRDRPERRSRTMSSHYLAPGSAYTFDTHRPHRVYATAPSRADRIHLVLGFAPWYRYDAAADVWEPNEFYGRVHPLDLVRSGALHPALGTP
jgi:hypothetical protein